MVEQKRMKCCPALGVEQKEIGDRQRQLSKANLKDKQNLLGLKMEPNASKHSCFEVVQEL